MRGRRVGAIALQVAIRFRWLLLLCIATIATSCGGSDAIDRAPDAAASRALVKRDFSIAVSPGAQSVADGAAANYTVSTVATTGGPQTVELSVSGLPAGVTGTLSPSTVAAGRNATLTVTASASAAPATVAFSVRGNNSTVTHTASATLTVTDATRPSATLLSPAAGGVLAGTVMVSASATDNVAVSRLEIWLDGTSIVSAVTPTAAVTWDTTTTTDGSHTLSAIAYDTSGNSASSGPAQVTVANGPSTRDFSVEIVAMPPPFADGATATVIVTTATLIGAPQPLGLEVAGLPPGVTAAIDRTGITSGESATVTLSAAPTSAGGPFMFTVRAAGLYAVHSAPGNGTIIDTVAPAVSMSLPLVVQGNYVLGLAGTDNTGIARGEIWIDGALATTAFSYVWDTTAAADGPHLIEGRAYDFAGNVGSTGPQTTTVQNSAATRDFAITISPGSRALADGSSTTFAVGTAATLGAPQTVQLSAVGLPSGVTGSFEPVAIVPGTAATLTLSAAATASPWTGSFCVAGTGLYATHETCPQLTIADATAPAVTLSAPGTGTALLAGTVVVQASASDNIGVVRSELYLDGALVASGLSWNWDTTASGDGAHTLEAAAWDAAGNRGSSGLRQVTVQNTSATRDFSVSVAPSNVTINQGAAFTFTITTATRVGAPQPLTLSLCCELTDLTAVSVAFSRTTILSGESATVTLTSSSWSPPTAHLLSLTAQGVYAARSQSLILSIRDVTPPAVTIASPANGTTVSGAVNLSASASDNTAGGVAQMQVVLDGSVFLQFNGNSLQYPLDTTTLADGQHTLAVTVWDQSLNRTTATSSFFVQNSAATRDFALSLSAPDASIVAGGPPVHVQVLTTAVVGSPEVVQLFVAQAPQGVTATIVDGNFLMLSAAPGASSGDVVVGGTGKYATHTATAAVLVGDQSSVTVSPSGGAVAGLVTLSGTAADVSGNGIAQVSLGLDFDTVAVSAGPTATGLWDTTVLPDGSTHTLVARALDDAGAVRFAKSTLTVQNSAATRDFTVSFVEPAVTVLASAPSQVSIVTQETIGSPQPLNIVASGNPYCLQLFGTNLVAGETGTIRIDASSCASSSGTITATANGLYTSKAVTIPITVIDDLPPSFLSSSPPDGATMSGIARLSAIVHDPTDPIVSTIAVDGNVIAQGTGFLQTDFDSRQLPDGPHTIAFGAVDGIGNAASRTAHVTVLNAPASHDLALNGGFESVSPLGAIVGWTMSGPRPPVRSATAHSGSWSLALGTQPGTGTSIASQRLWIPVQATSAALSFEVRGTVAGGSSDWQEAALYDSAGTLLQSLFHQQLSSDWTPFTADLDAYAGQVVELRFTVQGGPGTSLLVDDVAAVIAPDGVGNPAPCLAGGNILYLDGTAGDWVHPGNETITAGPWNAYFDPVSGFRVSTGANGYWSAEFNRRPMQPGVGEDATRAAFASYGAGIDVSGNGRGCNETSGRLQVFDAMFDAAGVPRSFTATFEQSCETWMPLLRGCIHFQQ